MGCFSKCTQKCPRRQIFFHPETTTKAQNTARRNFSNHLITLLFYGTCRRRVLKKKKPKRPNEQNISQNYLAGEQMWLESVWWPLPPRRTQTFFPSISLQPLHNPRCPGTTKNTTLDSAIAEASPALNSRIKVEVSWPRTAGSLARSPLFRRVSLPLPRQRRYPVRTVKIFQTPMSPSCIDRPLWSSVWPAQYIVHNPKPILSREIDFSRALASFFHAHQPQII